LPECLRSSKETRNINLFYHKKLARIIVV